MKARQEDQCWHVVCCKSNPRGASSHSILRSWLNIPFVLEIWRPVRDGRIWVWQLGRSSSECGSTFGVYVRSIPLTKKKRLAIGWSTSSVYSCTLHRNVWLSPYHISPIIVLEGAVLIQPLEWPSSRSFARRERTWLTFDLPNRWHPHASGRSLDLSWMGEDTRSER